MPPPHTHNPALSVPKDTEVRLRQPNVSTIFQLLPGQASFSDHPGGSKPKASVKEFSDSLSTEIPN